MKVIKGYYKNITITKPITLTIGNFDGVHLGHQELINTTKSYKDTKTALMTFNPHPRRVLRDVKFTRLMSLDQKIKTIESFNLDYMIITKFDRDFANITPLEFINYLKSLNVKRIVIGNDFRFGAYAKGKVKDLEEHFEVIIVEDIVENQMRVSTSYIKDLIATNNLDLASQMLGRNYEIEGIVIHGDKVGRTLGMPTANLDVNDYILPLNGVYYVHVNINGKLYAGALNIGYNPTVNYSVNRRTEVHILDFDEEIYDKKITLTFYEYLRPELKFNSKDELIKTMNNDIVTCREKFLKFLEK